MNHWNKAKRYIRGDKSSIPAAASPGASVHEGSPDTTNTWVRFPHFIIEILQPVTVQKEGYSKSYGPGDMVFLAEAIAKSLLDEPGNKVRFIAELMMIDDSVPEWGDYPQPEMCWEKATGEICGPAVLKFFDSDELGIWFFLDYNGQAIWVHASLMRTRQQFEAQCALREAEPGAWKNFDESLAAKEAVQLSEVSDGLRARSGVQTPLF